MTPLARPQERLLLDLLPELPAGRLLCNTAGRAQFAVSYARQYSQSPVTCWLLDLYHQQRCELAIHPAPQTLALVCQSDPPPDEVDLVAWAFSRQGESELLREMPDSSHRQSSRPMAARAAARHFFQGHAPTRRFGRRLFGN
jgi:16S rRNA (guanine1207-N2)-methyltransferase